MSTVHTGRKSQTELGKEGIGMDQGWDGMGLPVSGFMVDRDHVHERRYAQMRYVSHPRSGFCAGRARGRWREREC